MQTVNVAALAGTGLLVIGAMLSVSDLTPFDTPYAQMMGPDSLDRGMRRDDCLGVRPSCHRGEP